MAISLQVAVAQMCVPPSTSLSDISSFGVHITSWDALQKIVSRKHKNKNVTAIDANLWNNVYAALSRWYLFNDTEEEESNSNTQQLSLSAHRKLVGLI
jgi:hypothetical protein